MCVGRKWFSLSFLCTFIVKANSTRQVSSMIHSARPTVSSVATIVFCCFVFLDLKSGDRRTYGQHVRKQWSLRDCRLAEWMNSEEFSYFVMIIDFLQYSLYSTLKALYLLRKKNHFFPFPILKLKGIFVCLQFSSSFLPETCRIRDTRSGFPCSNTNMNATLVSVFPILHCEFIQSIEQWGY